ncbi:MAG: hypothetical protein F4Z22_10170 [Acidimicrobiia bacterium]|nr:hypothetical protein [Acidimicrobiia bacterium]
MAERSSPQNRYRVEFPSDGSEPYARLPLGGNWTSHPEAAAIGVELPGRQRNGNHHRAVTVEDCVEAFVVARRHKGGHDADGNEVDAPVSAGAGRVLKKLERCLEALAEAGVAGAAEALREARDPESRSRSASTSSAKTRGGRETSGATAWVARSGQEGKQTVDINLRENVVTLGWGDWVFDCAVAEHGDSLALDSHLIDHFPEESNSGKRKTARDTILRFRDEVRTGDLVVMPLKGWQTATGWVAIGRVTGSMTCDLSWTMGTRLRRSVEWVKTELPKDCAEEDLRGSIDSPGTLFRIDKPPHAVHRLIWLAEHGLDPGPHGIGALHLPGEEAGVLDADGNVIEGASKRVSVLRYETDPRARARCIAVHGTSCHVCRIDFGSTYGDFAEGYIHVHHKTPVHQAAADGEYELDPVSDLVPVCPNCHAMLHRHPDKPCSVEKLRRLMGDATQP